MNASKKKKVLVVYVYVRVLWKMLTVVVAGRRETRIFINTIYIYIVIYGRRLKKKDKGWGGRISRQETHSFVRVWGMDLFIIGDLAEGAEICQAVCAAYIHICVYIMFTMVQCRSWYGSGDLRTILTSVLPGRPSPFIIPRSLMYGILRQRIFFLLKKKNHLIFTIKYAISRHESPYTIDPKYDIVQKTKKKKNHNNPIILKMQFHRLKLDFCTMSSRTGLE